MVYIFKSMDVLHAFIHNLCSIAKHSPLHSAVLNTLFCLLLAALTQQHARRTGSGSPLGLLFDHGCDAINCTLGTFVYCTSISTGVSFPAVALCFANQAVPFFFATWEEYHTGESLCMHYILLRTLSIYYFVHYVYTIYYMHIYILYIHHNMCMCTVCTVDHIEHMHVAILCMDYIRSTPSVYAYT
jgi:hypothetical protein